MPFLFLSLCCVCINTHSYLTIAFSNSKNLLYRFLSTSSEPLAMVSPNLMSYSNWLPLTRYAASKVTAIPLKSRYSFPCAHFQTTAQRRYNTPTINIDHKIAGVEKVFDYYFKNKIICAESVQMAAPEALLSIKGHEYSIAHNKRLELVGDRIMELVL